MKKIVPYIVLVLCALLLWDLLFTFSDASFHIDGDEVDGPLGAALALLFGAGGTIIGVLVTIVVGAVLAVVFAGVGVVLVGALAVAAFAVTAAIVRWVACRRGRASPSPPCPGPARWSRLAARRQRRWTKRWAPATPDSDHSMSRSGGLSARMNQRAVSAP